MRAPGFEGTVRWACRALIPPLAVQESGSLFDLSRARASPARGMSAARGWPRRCHVLCFGIAQQSAQAARRLHGALDIGVLGILIEKQHDFASRALPGKAILQSPGALAKYALAPGAADLNGVHSVGAVTWKYPQFEHGDSEQIANDGRRRPTRSENWCS
jgi:hypothetical protein